MANFPFDTHAYISALLASHGIGAGGDMYFLNPGHTNASDGNDGWDPNHPLSTLAEAEDRCTANQNDVVFYVGMDSSVTLSAALTWDKNYTHLIGLGAPSTVGNRARIFQLATLTGASPLLTISATGCVFKNFYVFQGVDDATSLINVSVTGGRNYFENVHFAGGGHATQAINGGASLLLNGAEENRFVNCTVGVDTAEATDGYSALLLDGSAHRNIFENSRIVTYPAAAQTGVALVELADTAAADRYNEFRGCLFNNNSTNKGVTLASAFVIPAGHTTTATIYLDPACRLIGATDWDANDRGVVYVGSGAVAGGGTAGIAAVSAAT